MRRITQRTQFRNGLKRQKRRGKNVEELIAAVELLAENGVLPEEYRAHKLSGEWKGLWECHIEPDWLFSQDLGWVSSRFAQGRDTARPGSTGKLTESQSLNAPPLPPGKCHLRKIVQRHRPTPSSIPESGSRRARRRAYPS
jgi:mRNA interferase YafQ